MTARYNTYHNVDDFVLDNTIKNSIEYTYNAAGVKLKKTVVEETATPEVRIEVDYLDGFQYAGEMLNFFPIAEGYVRATPAGDITPGAPPTGYAYSYVFNYTDHLGNVRLSYSMDHLTGKLKILEENHYYPFGLRHGVYDTGGRKDFSRNPGDGIEPEPGLPPVLDYVTRMEYQYKYNGKEWQDELGLNFYDYGARNYDPALGRWMNIDPLAEQSRRFSPFTYALNNPVYFIDPDGMVATPPDDIYLNRNGKEIYREKNNQPDRTFIVQTSTKTHNKASSGLANTNPISAKDAKGTEKQIKAGNLEGDHMSNLVQIENADTQQQMLNVVNKDDGLGTEIIIEDGVIQNMEAYKKDNFTEHGGNIENGKVVNVRDGGANLPGYSPDGKAHIDSGVDFHDHPSGQVKVINSDGSYTTYRTQGFTTSDDVSWANGKTKYQFDMTGKKVNVYNSTGVIAIIPFANFGKK